VELNASEHRRGFNQAMVDIGSGDLVLYWQTRGAWGDLITSLMADRFGVVVRHTSDIATHEQISFWAGYNEAIALHINQQFGQGAYEAVLAEVERYREQESQVWLDETE
jgi:hypothetical protein